jgi:5-methyltetrahydropteroyltriglutamate--homocysteine methyltransferase
MAISSNLGFPRIGRRRELKQLLEAYWSGQADAHALESGTRALRLAHWRFQAGRGIDHIPSNDFSLYDHVLDTALMVGAVPARFRRAAERSALEGYFAMARGADQPALEMTKWFDTNYHYLVPEFEADTDFRLGPAKPVDEFREARAAGIHTRPVLLGPVSFLHLGKERGLSGSRLSLLPRLLPVYEQLLDRLAGEGADWIQMDEPADRPGHPRRGRGPRGGRAGHHPDRRAGAARRHAPASARVGGPPRVGGRVLSTGRLWGR